MSDVGALLPAAWLFLLRGRSSGLVVGGQRLPEVMSCGDAEQLQLFLLLHFRPQREPAREAEVKELAGGKGQRLLILQSFEPSSPAVQHRGSNGGRTVSRTPEDLRSQNLKATEVERAVLKETRKKEANE